ncbi:hypothetical protein ABWK22_01540 [Gottfriedia acidiceleris]|uniref:hypothetical protein n=1 Tax=Gottfriedia acidiceleris TaxID=371036 RepID=UPI00339559BE
MSAQLTFPLHYLSKEIISEIVVYYNITFDVDNFEEILAENDELDSFTTQCLDRLKEESEEIDYINGLVFLSDSERYDDERMTNLEDQLKVRHIPFDSLQADGLFHHYYRPEIGQILTSVINHPEARGTVICAEEVLSIIDSTTDHTKLKDILIKNIELMIRPVPVIENYVYNSNRNNEFIATGLRDLRLLA